MADLNTCHTVADGSDLACSPHTAFPRHQVKTIQTFSLFFEPDEGEF